MRTKVPGRRRGNTLPIALGGVLFLAFLTTLLSRMAPAEAPASRPRARYLDDASGVIARQRAKRSRREEASREKVEAARKRARSGAFRHSSAGTLFRGPGHGEGAVRSELHELLTSSEVLHRVFGGADGDFLYHRTRGWLKFVDGQWVAVRDDELPLKIAQAYPALVGPGAGSGDAEFVAAPWLEADDEGEQG